MYTSDIIAEELRAEMRNQIVAIFEVYDAKQQGIELLESFPTMQEVQVAYHYVINLNWRMMMRMACANVEMAVSIYSPQFKAA